MFAKARRFFIALSFTSLFVIFTGGPVFSALYTLDARDDAGLTVGQSAYVHFAGINGDIYPLNLSAPPTTAQQIIDVAPPNIAWTLEAAGNIWSADKTVGDSIRLPAGTYRIDAVSGGFLYDSFGWSPFKDVPLSWNMNIRAQVDGSAYSDTTLGSFLAKDVGTLPLYTYVALEGPGSLSFWINDGDSIDNSGSLTFSVTSVPAPPSLLLLAGGLPLFLSKVRNYLIR